MIYLQVGEVRVSPDIYPNEPDGHIRIEDYDGLLDYKRKLDFKREMIFATQKRFSRGQDKLILAVYREDEIKPSDLIVIEKHTLERAHYGEKGIEYYSFTHNHFFEYLREAKVRLLTNKGMIDLDDGTIFGKVNKEITIPERVIPEHKSSIFVDWDDWNDGYMDECDRE